MRSKTTNSMISTTTTAITKRSMKSVSIFLVSTITMTMTMSVRGMITSSSSSSTPLMETRIIGTQKCLIAPARQPKSTSPQESTSPAPPTLVLIGGTAQTITSWEHHLFALSKHRQVIVYECLGQGTHLLEKSNNDNNNNDDSSSSSMPLFQNVSLPKQAELLLDTLNELLEPDQAIDLVGFSFGGRVAMATAAYCIQQQQLQQQRTIRKLHLTGVGIDRSNFGHLTIQSWKDMIRIDPTLQCFAWSALLATYSSDFLKRQPSIDRYINHICSTNTPQGLLALLEQADLQNNINDPWHVVQMAKRIREYKTTSTTTTTEPTTTTTTTIMDGKLCVGEFDLMAPVEHVQELSKQLGWSTEPTIIPNCAHAVTLENARAWREDVLSFLG